MPSEKYFEIRKTITKDKLREDIPIAQKRREWEEAALKSPVPSTIETKDETIGNVPCLWIHEKQSQDHHVIVYVHGGGLTEGSAITTREFAIRLTQTIHIPILVVDYRLAPEHPFPAALDDVQAVYKGLLARGYTAERIIIGGDSNGGGLALSTLVALRDAEIQQPICAFLISPVADLTFSGESMITRNEVDPFTSKEVLVHCAKLYAQGADLKSPLVSPLFANLSDLPPTLLQVGDHEILLSDSVRLAEKMNATLKIWDEMWHVWHCFAELPEAQLAIEEIRDFIWKNIQRQ